MRNKGWQVGDARWNTALRQRVERRFRGHVRTRSNPRGRIHREPCPWCPAGAEPAKSEAHHISYRNPFKVVWCCFSHHRKIEAGSVKVFKKHVWDYKSVVILVPKLTVEHRKLAA